MSEIGNWRKHTLVKCDTCSKLMGYHVVTATNYHLLKEADKRPSLTCIDCELKKRKEVTQ